jgi:AcrR family transcriptional regulator
LSTKPNTAAPRLPPRRRVRLAADERRRELLAAAARLMTRDGVDAVQFAEVAVAAGVTRQLVYKFFPNRQALIMAVLEDFADDLEQRFGGRAARGFPKNMTDATRVFVDAVCDTIEAKGVGPWRLLDAGGPDAEIARLAHAIDDRLLAPWHPRIALTTGASPREVAALARMIVAAGRAVLELWYGGVLTREEAVRDASRGVSAMLAAFTVPREKRS